MKPTAAQEREKQAKLKALRKELDQEIQEQLEEKNALEELTGIPDRTNRRIIAEKLRRFGEAVVASSGQSGYFMAQTPGDWDELEESYKGRALNELTTLNAIRRRRAEKSGQQAVLVEIVWDAETGQGRLIA